MQKPAISVVLSGALLASVLVAPAGAQSGSASELCNGLTPTIVGTAGDDVLQGTWKDDVIWAGDGNDTIRGASGADVICGGAGDDRIYGDSQVDLIFGGAGNDTIYGGSAEDTIYGGEGNDVLYGDSQDDLIYGEGGDDIIHGGADDDEVHGGDGDDEIFGNSQDDTLFGNAGDDRIDGGPDEDTLDGGSGTDHLNGLWQNDTCVNGTDYESCENVLPGTPDAPEGPVLLTGSEIAWLQGSSEWVNLLWTADSDLTNVEVRVTSQSSQLEVEYPSDSALSRPSVDTEISVSEIDYTAVRFTTGTGENLTATIEISWDDADGVRQTNEYPLTLTNREYEGEDFAILTEAVAVGTDADDTAANWVDLDYLGIAPTNSAMTMTVTSDVPVYHPQDTFTSLHHDEVLHAGEADVARVWFDPELAVPGTYTIVVNIDYVNTNGVERTTTHEVELVVE